MPAEIGDDAAIAAFPRRCRMLIDDAASGFADTRCGDTERQARNPALARRGCFHMGRYAIYETMLERLRDRAGRVRLREPD